MRHLTLLAAWGMMAASSAAPAHSEIVVAVTGPTTGRYAVYGAAMLAGAQLAVEDLNRRGGVVGEKVTLKDADDACDRERAVIAARRLVSEDVRLVVGHYCESASMAAGAIYAGADVIQIIPAMSAGPLSGTKGGPNIFSLSGRAADQGQVAARFIAAHYLGKRVAILHDRTRHGLGHADSVKRALRSGAASGSVSDVLFAPLVAGEKDYGALVARLKDAGTDLVYFGGFPTEAALLVRQMRQAGLEAILMGPDVLAAQEFWELAGTAGEGTLVTHFRDAAQLAAARSIVPRLRERGVEPSPSALRSYTAVMMWAAGAARAGSPRSIDVARIFSAGHQETLLGPVTFDERGEGDLPSYAVFRWRQGALEPAE
jgi:branched-chain amino acid transport system substrate-binding protein